MHRHLVAAADLLIGADCPGCGRPAITWCRACAVRVRPAPREVDAGLDVPVAAAGENVDELRRFIVAWKERGRFGLLEPLGDLLASACAWLDLGDDPIALVPVPTSRRNVRQRGEDVVADLASAAARSLRRTGVDARAVPALRRVRATADQSGLGRDDRRHNVAGAFVLRERPRGAERRTPVVVDDIVTSGASLAEAVRALDAGGWPAAGAAVVASTPGPTAATEAPPSPAD